MLAEHTHVFVDLQLKKVHVTFFSVDIRSHTTTNIPVIKSFNEQGSIKPKYASVYTEVRDCLSYLDKGIFHSRRETFSSCDSSCASKQSKNK